MNDFEKGLMHTILGEYASMLKKQLAKYNGNNSITDEINIKLEYVDLATQIIHKVEMKVE